MWGGQERNLWIGLHDADPLNNATNYIERRAEFAWASGEPVTFANWSAAEPNNYRQLGEHYVHTLSASASTTAGTWNDTWDTNFNQRPIYGVVEVENREPISLPVTLWTDVRSLEISGRAVYCPTALCQTPNYQNRTSPSPAFAVFNSGLTGSMHLGFATLGAGGSHASSEAMQNSTLESDRFEAVGAAFSTAFVGLGNVRFLPPFADAAASSTFDIIFYVPETVSYRFGGQFQVQSVGRSGFVLSRVEGPNLIDLTIWPGNTGSQLSMDLSGILLPGEYRLRASAGSSGGANKYESYQGSARFNISGAFAGIGTVASQSPSRVWGELGWPLGDGSLVIRPPFARTNVIGSSLMLSAGAEGNKPLTYQWFKDGTILPGAIGRIHILTNVQPNDAGVYQVTVANFVGLASSDTMLTIIPAEMPTVVAGPIINPANGNEYYLIEQSRWVEAETRAQALGGHLATLRNAAEQEWVFTTFSTWGGQERNLWIGFHDADPLNNSTNYVARRAEFVWASGEPVTYLKWSDSEPNNGSNMGDYYVHLLSASDSTSAGKWNDTWDTDFNQMPFHGVAEVVRRRTVSSSRIVAEHFELNVSGLPGEVYQIQASTNLVHWEIVGVVTNLTGTAQFTDSQAANFSQRFFRFFTP
jgi:hypothetical protein